MEKTKYAEKSEILRAYSSAGVMLKLGRGRHQPGSGAYALGLRHVAAA